MNVTSAQLRGARAMLGWTTARLGTASKIHRRTVADIERGRTQPQEATATRLVAALEQGGVVFAEGGFVGIKPAKMEFSAIASGKSGQ